MWGGVGVGVGSDDGSGDGWVEVTVVAHTLTHPRSPMTANSMVMRVADSSCTPVPTYAARELAFRGGRNTSP